MKQLAYLKDVATLSLDPEKCVGCGLCLEVCPQAVFALPDKVVVIQDRDACMECGACMVNCPSGALNVEAGVGCAQAVINSALGRKSSDCCCSLEPRFRANGDQGNSPEKNRGCCS